MSVPSEAAQTPPTKFRFRTIPVLVTILLGFGLPILGGQLLDVARHYTHLLPSPFGPKLPWLYAQHGAQMLLALLVIWVMKWLVPADYGLHMPARRSYLAPAIFWGLLSGLLLTVVDYGPQIAAQLAPRLGYPLTAGRVMGWLGFEGVYAGPTEEILFRSLLVTYLATTMPGRLRVYRYEMNWAGIVVAAVYALGDLRLDAAEPLWAALLHRLCAFALGVLYAYWLEKSKSVLAPIVGHNVGNVTEYVLLLLMVAFWA